VYYLSTCPRKQSLDNSISFSTNGILQQGNMTLKHLKTNTFENNFTFT